MAENALVIILDTARARSCYPERTGVTPTLRELGADGTVFTRAISSYPWSLASHASMYTGKYATEHGATTESRFLPEDVPVLAEQLQAAGVSTGVFTGNLYLSETFGMARGFDETDFMQGRGGQYFEDAFDPLEFLTRQGEFAGPAEKYRAVAREVLDGNVLKNLVNGVYFKFFHDSTEEDAAAAKGFDRDAIASAEAFLRRKADADERFFAVVNLLGAHAPWPYDPEKLRAIGVEPEEIAPREAWESVAERSAKQWEYAAGDVTFDETERELLEHLYESWVHEADRLAGGLLETLEETGTREETLCVVTSDHGEMICEDGVLGHNVALDGSVARVPLVVDGPSVESATVDHPVSLKDLYGTVLSRMGVDADAPTFFESAESALSETHGSDPERIGRIDPDYPDRASVERFFQTRRALYTADAWVEKSYGDGTVRGDQDLLGALETAVSQLSVADAGTPGPAVEGDVQERLRNLGYAE